MLAQLKALADLVADGTSGIARFGKAKARRDAVLEFLRIYFLLLDVTQDARRLLDSAGADPARTLLSLPDEAARERAAEWDAVLYQQAGRLHLLGGKLLGQDALAVIDPELRVRLAKLIGNKMDRVRTLHGLGAQLFFYAMFGIGRTRPEERFAAVAAIFPQKRRLRIDVPQARAELVELERALERFRETCLRFATPDEVVALSRKARRDTQPKKQRLVAVAS